MVKRQQALCQLLHRVFYNTNYTMEWNQKKKKILKRNKKKKLYYGIFTVDLGIYG